MNLCHLVWTSKNPKRALVLNELALFDYNSVGCNWLFVQKRSVNIN